MKEFINLLLNLTTAQLWITIQKNLASEEFYVPTVFILDKIVRKEFVRENHCINPSSPRLPRATHSAAELKTLDHLCQMIYEGGFGLTIDQHQFNLFQSNISQTEFNACTIVPWKLLNNYNAISSDIVDSEVYVDLDDTETEDILLECDGITLLSFAVYCRNEKIVNCLLNYGWNFEEDRISKQSILDMLLWKMVTMGDEKMVKILVNAGATLFHSGLYYLSSKKSQRLSTLQVALLTNTRLFLFLLSKFPKNFSLLRMTKDEDISILAAEQNPFYALDILLTLGYNTSPNLLDDRSTLEHMFDTSHSSLRKTTVLLIAITQLLLVGDYIKDLNQRLFDFLSNIKTFLDDNALLSSEHNVLSRTILIYLEILARAKIFERFSPELRAVFQEIMDVVCKHSTKCIAISLKEICILHIKHNSLFHSQRKQYDLLPIDLQILFKMKYPLHWQAFLMQVFITFNDIKIGKDQELCFYKLEQLLSNMKSFYPEKFNQFMLELQSNIKFGEEMEGKVQNVK